VTPVAILTGVGDQLGIRRVFGAATAWSPCPNSSSARPTLPAKKYAKGLSLNATNVDWP
jgi:hypothetical protein